MDDLPCLPFAAVGRIWKGSLLTACRMASVSTRVDKDDAQEQHPSVAGLDVLEIGCGRALPGILAGSLGAKRVVSPWLGLGYW